MRRICISIVLLSLFLFASCRQEDGYTVLEFEAPYQNVEAIRVIDGNTFVAIVGGKEERCRILCTDTPARGEPGFERAAESLKRYLEAGQVDLDFKTPGAVSRDRDGRILVYVRVTRESFYTGVAFISYDVGLRMIRNGLSPYFTEQGRAIDDEAYREAEEKAKAAKRGIWAENLGYVSSDSKIDILPLFSVPSLSDGQYLTGYDGNVVCDAPPGVFGPFEYEIARPDGSDNPSYKVYDVYLDDSFSKIAFTNSVETPEPRDEVYLDFNQVAVFRYVGEPRFLSDGITFYASDDPELDTKFLWVNGSKKRPGNWNERGLRIGAGWPNIASVPLVSADGQSVVYATADFAGALLYDDAVVDEHWRGYDYYLLPDGRLVYAYGKYIDTEYVNVLHSYDEAEGDTIIKTAENLYLLWEWLYKGILAYRYKDGLKEYVVIDGHTYGPYKEFDEVHVAPGGKRFMFMATMYDDNTTVIVHNGDTVECKYVCEVTLNDSGDRYAYVSRNVKGKNGKSVYIDGEKVLASEDITDVFLGSGKAYCLKAIFDGHYEYVNEKGKRMEVPGRKVYGYPPGSEDYVYDVTGKEGKELRCGEEAYGWFDEIERVTYESGKVMFIGRKKGEEKYYLYVERNRINTALDSVISQIYMGEEGEAYFLATIDKVVCRVTVTYGDEE